MNWGAFWGTFAGVFLGNFLWEVIKREDDDEAQDEC